MNVSELIAGLSKCDPDRTVCVDWDGTESVLVEIAPEYAIGSEPSSRRIVVLLIGDPTVFIT
jgi:hypothetical protein